MSSISERDFVSVLKKNRCAAVFDLRPLPTFASGSFSRRDVFQLFGDVCARYCDCAGLVGWRRSDEALLSSGQIQPALAALVCEELSADEGVGSRPALFLVDTERARDVLTQWLPAVVPPHPSGIQWNISFVP